MHYIRNFFGHLHTVNKHRFKVFVLCCKVGIPWQGLIHDLSKYNPQEFFEGVKYYANGLYSPIMKEKKEIGYISALSIPYLLFTIILFIILTIQVI